MKSNIEDIGQLFVFGFPDVTPSLTFLDFIEETQPGGVILFGNNCVDHQAAKESICRIKERYKERAPFIAIDQEGGRVSRMRGAPAEISAAATYAGDNNVEKFAEDYSRSLLYLESLGINLNLAPVADIGIGGAGGCLEERTFGDDPQQVAKFVKTAVKVSHRVKVLSCLKHFPGLGAAAQDPHTETATADYDFMDWSSREMIPFAAGVEAGADMIMTTHLMLPKIDDLVVTGSRKIIADLIRKEIGFEGPIISDDLSMKGASGLGHIGERTVRAFLAGHDLLLFGQNFDLTLEAYEHFVNACEYGEIKRELINESLSRIAGIKFRLAGSVV